MYKNTIWILEDEVDSLDVYSEILGSRYDVRSFRSLQELKARLIALKDTQSEPKVDLLIADLRLPDGNFLSFISTRESDLLFNIPFLVVSSLDDLDILRSCFEEGAMDYLTKPFTKNELLAKIERYLAQAGASQKPSSDITLDPITFSLKKNDSVSPQLTLKEVQIYNIVESAGDKGIPRSEMLRTIWGKTISNGKTLDVHLFNLRKKLSHLGVSVQFDENTGRYRVLGHRLPNLDSSSA